MCAGLSAGFEGVFAIATIWADRGDEYARFLRNFTQLLINEVDNLNAYAMLAIYSLPCSA